MRNTHTQIHPNPSSSLLSPPYSIAVLTAVGSAAGLRTNALLGLNLNHFR